MSKEISEVKKVCQFLSQILVHWQNNADFNIIKSLLIELLKGSIDFYRFKDIFPHNLPKACLEIMESHLSLMREQFAMGLLEIQFINNSVENKNHTKSNLLPISFSCNNTNKLELHKTINTSNNVKPVSFINNNNETKILKVSSQISFSKNNSFPSKRLVRPASYVPNERPIIKINSQKQDYFTDKTILEPKIIKAESSNVIIPAKKKIIGISNQCDTHSELKALPSLQTFDLSNTSLSNIDKKSINIPTDSLVDSSLIAREKQIHFIVDETIQKVAISSGIMSINDDVIPYIQSMLDIFAEQLLVHAAYYTMHRENCKNTFKSDSVLYKETDNVRAFHKSLKNSQQFAISNQEREEKEKNYLEKGKLADGMKRKEEMKVLLSNTSLNKSNSVLNNIFGNTRKISNAPIVPTFRFKKRITAKDFLIVFRQNQKLQKIRTFKLIVAAANQ